MLLVQTGSSKKAKELAKAAGDRYLDIRPYLELTAAYWMPATAFHVIATQADLVPDGHVNAVRQSRLVQHLPTEERKEFVRVQLARASRIPIRAR